MFSKDHYDKTLSIEKKSGSNYKFGTVTVNGFPKVFTSITRNPESYTKVYSDAKVVVSGDIRKIRYTEPS
jgi:hypothetical protein